MEKDKVDALSQEKVPIILGFLGCPDAPENLCA